MTNPDEALYAFILFVGGGVIGSAVTVLLIHFLAGWS